MRKIDKRNPIQQFIDFLKKANPTTWDEFDNDIRRETKDFILLEEQFLLCGYTELYIDHNYCHIDHYIKRSLDNNKCYDWDNFIVAVNDDDFGAKYKDGPNGVKSLLEYNLVFNPVIDKAQDFFRYTTDGKIHPIENLSGNNLKKAENTISIFNLNHNTLKNKRQGLFYSIQSLKDGGRTIEQILVDVETQGFKSMVEYAVFKFFN